MASSRQEESEKNDAESGRPEATAPELVSGLSKKKYAALHDAVYRDIFPTAKKPGTGKAVFTGGLSGLGKTTMVEAVLREAADGVIDANDLRNFHPRYPEYINEYGSEMARDLTRDFCDRLAVDLQSEALVQGRSFVREGTLQLPGSCIPEAMQAAAQGHDVVLVVLVAQAGDEELGRHLRHWEMRGEKERLALTRPEQARSAYVREIEHTYDDARAQSAILLTLGRIEEGLKRHISGAKAQTAQKIPAHRIVIVGTDGVVKYVNDFAEAKAKAAPDKTNMAPEFFDRRAPEIVDRREAAWGWQVAALEYDRNRTPEEVTRLIARLRRTRQLMHNFVASDKEWLTFQRLIDNRLARSLPGAETARPQRELARQDQGITSRFDPPSVWSGKTAAALQELISRPAG